MKYDCIIVGSGPAGVSAGIYTARAGLSTLNIAKDAGALAKAESVENFYGFPEPVDAADLLERGKRQAQRFGAVFVADEVFGINEEEVGFSIECATGIYETWVVILATGKQRKKPQIPGLAEFEGRGISCCAVCDGAFYKGKRIAVLGGGDYALHEAAILRAYSPQITLLTNGEALPIDTPYPSDPRKIAEINGEKRLTGLRFTGGDTLPIDALFLALGTAGTVDFAKRLGIEENNSSVKIDRSGVTNVPGLFAAGDCTGGLMQIAKAAGEGAVAGCSAVDYLKDVRNK
jgi:thioredoxin reductase (NADPH)